MKNLKDEIEGILEAIIGDMDYVSEYCDGTDSREQAEENREKLLAFITSLIEQEKERVELEALDRLCDWYIGQGFRENEVKEFKRRYSQYLAERKG